MNLEFTLPFQDLQIGEPKPYGDFLLYPLFLKNTYKRPEYRTLHSPDIRKKVIISELPHSTVGNVQVENLSDYPVLIPSGQSLIGAKQNRTSNTDFLIAPHSKAVIGVSCTEQGRWRLINSSKFDPGEDLDPISLKIHKISHYTDTERLADRQNHRSTRSRGSLQSQIWHQISQELLETQTSSSTHALSDYMRKRKQGEKEKGIQIPRASEGQEGVAVSLRSSLIGLEFYCGYENYHEYHLAAVRDA